MKNFCDFSLVT